MAGTASSKKAVTKKASSKPVKAAEKKVVAKKPIARAPAKAMPVKKASVKAAVKAVPVKKAPAKAVAKKVAAVKAPAKAAAKKVVAKKAPVKAAVKAPVNKKAPAKVAAKPAVKKAPVKAVAKAPAAKKAASKPAAKPAAKKATSKASSKQDEGQTINDLITPRPMEIKSEEELLGIKKPEDTRNKPVIPGKFDLILPPGTPRKLILTLAKDFDVEIVVRTDVYVPIGISDLQRELLAIRGDEKTIKKFEKIVLDKLKEIAADDGIGPNASYDERVKANKGAKKVAVAKKASKARA